MTDRRTSGSPRLAGWALAGATALALGAAAGSAGGCDPASIENKACDSDHDCVAGYACCPSQKVCLTAEQVCVDAGNWPKVVPTYSPLAMDEFTVFAASQSGLNIGDPQVADLHPDMVIRGWQQWSYHGILEDNYTQDAFPYMRDVQGRGIKFLGGAAATALFKSQFPNDPHSFDDFATVDPYGRQVSHDGLSPGMHRATLANPAFRDYLVGIAEIQLRAGVDGLNFEDLNETYQGAGPEAYGNLGPGYYGNEGFDKYSLADFNAFLLDKFAGQDVRQLFDMPANNYLRADVPAGDLVRNFDYRKYLVDRGVADDPLGAMLPPAPRASGKGNLLAGEWGRTKSDRPAFGALNFVDQAVPYRYWKEIVDRLRRLARTFEPPKEIFISAKGIYPFVDFQSVALNSWNADGPGGEPLNFLPLDAGKTRLDARQSLQPAFQRIKELAAAFTPGAPVVVYLDGLQPEYDALTAQERSDYWRIYAAEAYANGLFFAFRLTTPADPMYPPPATATAGGVFPVMRELATFYKAHDDLYHHVQPSSAEVSTSLPAETVKIAVSDRTGSSPPARLVHLVNHDYQLRSADADADADTGLLPHPSFTVSIPITAPVSSVQLVSPDLPPSAPPQPLEYIEENGRIRVTLPSLVAYDVVVVSY